jgi:hypothetical protein
MDSAVLRNTVTGVNLTAGAASTSAAIPNNSAGVPAKYVRVAVVGAGAAHIRFGKGAQTAVATDLLIVGQAGSEVFDVGGCDTVAVIQEGTGGLVNVAPMEWA